MTKVVAVNGSPRMQKGHTARMLEHFLGGMEDSGATVKLHYANQVRARPCTGDMNCWYKRPGRCHIHDGMQAVYPDLREADLLVLATPVYIPLPGEMQNFINRLCPLAEPLLERREGRTRARLREGVRMSRIALLATGAWWERENLDTVVRIAEELAADLGVEFGGAVLRPHAFLLEQAGERAEAVLRATRQAGRQLAAEGRMSEEVLEVISQPLMPEEALRDMWNALNQRALAKAAGRPPSPDR